MNASRDRYLLALLPSLVLVAAYVLWLAPSLAERRERADLSTRRAPLPGQLAALLHETERLRDDEQSLKDAATRIEAGFRELEGSWTDPRRRAATSVELSKVLAAHDFVVARSEMVDTPIAGIPPAFQEFARAMEQRGLGRPEVWHCEARGAWSRLLDVLEAIDGLDGFSQPLSLSVASDLTDDHLEVQLWIWI